MSEKFRLRRTMMFANAQKPSLVKDAYIYKPDSLIIDLFRRIRKILLVSLCIIF